MIDIATGQKLTAILRNHGDAYQAMLGQGLVNQAIYFRLFLAW
jgi:stage V sporulation protein SpoVS